MRNLQLYCSYKKRLSYWINKFHVLTQFALDGVSVDKRVFYSYTFGLEISLSLHVMLCLPPLVKASESVTGFKRGLDAFRLHGYQANKLGHHWELSYDIFDRIDVSILSKRIQW